MAKGAKGGYFYNSNITEFVDVEPDKSIQDLNYIPVEEEGHQDNTSTSGPEEGIQFISLKKEQYGAVSFNNIMDKSFSQFDNDAVNQNIQQLFEIYNSTFYGIPKTGSNSHYELMTRSTGYLTDYIDPRDEEINELNIQIQELNSRIIDLEASGAAALAGLGTGISDIYESIADIEAQLQGELDELFYSAYEPSYVLPKAENFENELASAFLMDGTNVYYKPEYYGKKIYSWSHDKYDSGAELIVCKLAETNPAPFTTHIRVLVLNDGANGNDRQISEIPGRRWKNNYNYRNELKWQGSLTNLAPDDSEAEVSSPEDETDYPDALGG